MGNFYQHPFRNFGNGGPQSPSSSGPSEAAPQSTSYSDPAQGAPQAAQSAGGGGGGASDSIADNIFGLIFQGPQAKFLIPAIFLGLSFIYLYIYDSVTSYSGGNPLASKHRKPKAVAEDQINDEELIDRAFESDGVAAIRAPEDDGTRSVEEARSQAGLFGNLFCKGLKRSRWCD